MFEIWPWSGHISLVEAAVLGVFCLSSPGLPWLPSHSLADVPSYLPVPPAAVTLLLSSLLSPCLLISPEVGSLESADAFFFGILLEGAFLLFPYTIRFVFAAEFL